MEEFDSIARFKAERPGCVDPGTSAFHFVRIEAKPHFAAAKQAPIGPCSVKQGIRRGEFGESLFQGIEDEHEHGR